ncbi:unnamed protein product [Notodromas monacha]|uniref:CWF21 domain-containing protein n=1 Tax=Notodromas monacha TaxID=399045 RepID=A0A7R9BMP1_9CRUS|nr:unnamed protein product [Notodromas monacha]CAG0918017.1 unnamed protein product [Notodromas monacha]
MGDLADKFGELACQFGELVCQFEELVCQFLTPVSGGQVLQTCMPILDNFQTSLESLSAIFWHQCLADMFGGNVDYLISWIPDDKCRLSIRHGGAYQNLTGSPIHAIRRSSSQTSSSCGGEAYLSSNAMHNGIGLATPRGSGTNGYVQRNSASIRRIERTDYKTEDQLQQMEKKANRAPNVELIDHERKRQLEVKVTEFQDELETTESDLDLIDKLVNEYRQKLIEEFKLEERVSNIHPTRQPRGLTWNPISRVRSSLGPLWPPSPEGSPAPGISSSSGEATQSGLPSHCPAPSVKPQKCRRDISDSFVFQYHKP